MTLKQYQQFQEAINYLESLGNLTDVNFFAGTSNPAFHFSRAKYLLKLAGNPDKDLKIIHVAGTSGKGTTCNLIYNILQAAGHKVGAHFSPYVSVPTEKIQINNKFISTTEFIALVEEVKPIIKKCYETKGVPSYFEIWVVLALLYFKKQKCDYVVLEVGCGGRYDATNAVGKTIASIITNIGLDHTHILGNTHKKIAFEKAGIIRRRGNVFTSTERPDALEVIENEAQKQNANLIILQKQENPNESLAMAVAEHLNVKATAIKKGIQQARLPGRLETMQQNPLIIIDGAHNADKIKFLSERIKKIKYNKLHLVCGLTNLKKPHDVFKNLLPLVDKFYITRFTVTHRKVTPPLDLKKSFRSKKSTQIFLDPQMALARAIKSAQKDDLILITGSFFLCGELRKNWIDEITQLTCRKNFIK